MMASESAAQPMAIIGTALADYLRDLGMDPQMIRPYAAAEHLIRTCGITVGGSPAPPSPPLPPRELQILRRVSHGMSNTEIGDELGIAPETVKSIMCLTFRRIGARNRGHAACKALRTGWIG